MFNRHPNYSLINQRRRRSLEFNLANCQHRINRGCLARGEQIFAQFHFPTFPLSHAIKCFFKYHQFSFKSSVCIYTHIYIRISFLLSRTFCSVLINGTFGIPQTVFCPTFPSRIRGCLARQLSRQIIRVAVAKMLRGI